MATTNRLDALRLRLVAGETAKRMGARIRAQRLAKGIRTQRELADRIDNDAVNNQRVSDWERGVHQPSERHLKQLAAALDVDIAYFYGAEEQPETPPLLEVLNGGNQPQLDRIEEKLDRLLGAIEPLSQLNGRLRLLEAQALADEAEELARSEEVPTAKARPRRRPPR